MNKAELIEAVAAQTKVSKKEAGAVISAATEVIGKTLKKGDKVTLIGFGTFEVAKTKKRNGHNPQTGKKMVIPAAKRPKFRAGTALKTLVNGTKKK